MDFLVVNYPNEALPKFEEVSYLIKLNDMDKLNSFLSTHEGREYACHDDAAAKATSKYIERANAFFEVSLSIFIL